MPQDAFTLSFLSKELNNILANGKVNKIVQVSQDEIILTVYNGKRAEKLYISVSPSQPRITLIKEDKPAPLTAPNFCMLLRKHLLSATLNGISIVGYDRIVKLDFTANSEFFDAGNRVLYIELMGRYSNIILTENGKILGTNRGNFVDSEVRPLIVSSPYIFPPVQDKKLPTDTKLIDIFVGANKENLAEKICLNVQGISTATAEEISYRYFTKKTTFNAQDFFEFFNQFLSSPPVSPCASIDSESIKDFSVFPYITAQNQTKSFSSIIDAENYYFNNKIALAEIKNKSSRITSVVTAQIKKVKKRITAISARLKEANNAEQNKLYGELIYANIYKLKQGDDTLKCLNYYDNLEIEIPLDKNLSPSKNAEYYYKKYNKNKRALLALTEQMQSAEKELDYFSALLEQQSVCDNAQDLDYIIAELIEGKYIKASNTNRKKQNLKEFREYLVQGFTVMVGRNNIENDKITANAKPYDIWLHAKDYHSSHIVIKTDKNAVPISVIEICAEICAYYSKGRAGGKTEIVYTQKQNVKKPKGSALGFCTYNSYQSITVSPKNHAEFLKTN